MYQILLLQAQKWILTSFQQNTRSKDVRAHLMDGRPKDQA